MQTKINQCLLNYTQLFESDTNYIFYVLSVSQQLKRTSKICLILKKACASDLTGMRSQNFSERVRTFIASDHVYQYPCLAY